MKKLLFNKESFFIAFIFLLFFPLKTQFQNLIYIILDATIYEKHLLDLYKVNYTGHLFGCFEKARFLEFLEDKNYFVSNLFWILGHTISLFTGVIFLKIQNASKFYYFKWILLVISCFSIYNSLELIISFIPHITEITINDNILYFAMSFLFIIFGLIIFLRLKKEDKLRVVLVALPCCILGGVIWFMFLGTIILPII